jgi:predicted AAA+ superfamily ATPase
MEIAREKYLGLLVDRMHNGMVKVVTGIRRAGKSYLLFHIFRDYLVSHGVQDSHIISVALDMRENEKFRDPDVMLNYVKSRISDSGDYYVILDEIQLLDDFVGVLNSLLHIDTLDIYVTGSNSKFLSKDVITEFRGRGDEIHVYPLTFREFMSVYQGDVYHGWADYLTYGGLPLILTMKSEQQKVSYLTNLFSETYLKDILERNHLEKTQELEDVIDILASDIGSLTNPNKILATFQSEMHSKISLNTIKHYIDCLEEAFLICKAKRFDIKGRKYINTPMKYFYEDVGLRNARLGFRQIERNHVMENIIFNELRYRGFSVDVGTVFQRGKDANGKQMRNGLEVDFVANLGNRRYYIQSAYRMEDDVKVRQEKKSLYEINDSFKKIIIVQDVMNVSRDEKGIATMDVYNFLLHEGSLDF